MTVHEPVARPAGPSGKLPPGQRRVEGFPRFGTQLSRPAPPVAADPVVTVRGAVTEAFDRVVIEPALGPDVEITHVVFRGLDRYRSVLLVEDAMADGVLVADRLDGRPLDGDHGAPVRLVSPAQYGYMSTKHLRRIEVHAGEPKRERWTLVESWLLRSHPRARVAEEERHGLVPGWLVRPFYAALKAPLLALTARGRRAG